MPLITLNLTDTQYKSLEYISFSPEKWAENAVTERARVASEEIVNLAVQHCLNNGIQIPATREEIIAYAFETNLVKTIQERNSELNQSN